MTLWTIDAKKGKAALTLPAALYSEDALRIAGHVFSGRARVSWRKKGKERFAVLSPLRATAASAELEGLAGEFLNELLNQEYRFRVGRLNARITNLIVTQALLSARGEGVERHPAEEATPQFAAEVERLVKEAEEEIQRTMPRKLPPQGTPLPPEADGPR